MNVFDRFDLYGDKYIRNRFRHQMFAVILAFGHFSSYHYRWYVGFYDSRRITYLIGVEEILKLIMQWVCRMNSLTYCGTIRFLSGEEGSKWGRGGGQCYNGYDSKLSNT